MGAVIQSIVGSGDAGVKALATSSAPSGTDERWMTASSGLSLFDLTD